MYKLLTVYSQCSSVHGRTNMDKNIVPPDTRWEPGGMKNFGCPDVCHPNLLSPDVDVGTSSWATPTKIGGGVASLFTLFPHLP